jgi:hypothetical protein
MFSDPVVGNRFFGRADSLKVLSKRVDGLKDGFRQNIAVVGPKLIGKSSLVLHFLANFNQPNIIPIYIDMRANSFYQFIYKFLGAVLYHYLKKNNQARGEEFDLLKGQARSFIPKTVAVVQEIENCMKNSQFNLAYEKLLTLTSILKKESAISCIVILDEFHLLDTYKIKEPFLCLAKEIMIQKDTMYLLLSSQVSYAKKILANQLSLLFGNFEVIHLEPFDYDTCCRFLEKRFQHIHVSRHFKDFLIAFSERCPFYLDILSNKVVQKAKEFNRQEITPGLIGQAFNSLIYDSQGILNQYFSNLLTHNLNGADYANFLPILLSASTKGCRLNEISESTHRHPQVIARYTSYLLNKDLLGKSGVFYKMRDKIFRFWIRSVYQRKSQSLSADPATESKDFSKEIEDEISDFALAAKKKLIERIIDLFKSFRNEIIPVQNKSVKLWHFDQVQALRLGQVQEGVVARYKDRYWVCLIKKEGVNEAQVQEFIQYCKTAKYKVSKLIIIALKELDLNVRLAALEKKIWIWHLDDLNVILDLYGHQQIVC